MQKLSDHNILADLLVSLAWLAQQYSAAALECPHAPVRNEMLSLMNEEHRLHADIFSELEKRGLCSTQKADIQKIDQIKEKFKNAIV